MSKKKAVAKKTTSTNKKVGIKKVVTAKKTTTTKKKVATKKASKKLDAYIDEVKKRAYQIFLERGKMHGAEISDWLQAEIEIKAKYKIK